MAGMTIDRAMRYLKRKLDRTASKPVRIIAPGEAGGESIELDAVPLSANFRDFTADEFAISAEEFDWIVQADELVFPLAGKLSPVDGWQIRYVQADGRTAVYVVHASGAGRCFDVEDPLGILMNVHTKLDRIESA